MSSSRFDGLRFEVRSLRLSQQRQTSNVKLQTILGLCILLLLSCSTKPESHPNTSSTKFQQYFLQGEELYIKHCSNCHQKNGTGLGLLYPPLNESDFVDQNFEAVLCLMRYGKEGELIVNGKSFNKEMPAIPSLTDLEIAEIATYVYNTWERERGIVEVQDVSRILSQCDRNTLLQNLGENER